MNGSVDVVNILLRQNRINLELEDRDGNTAFILSCEFGHVNTAEILLTNGANVAKVNSSNRRGFDYLQSGIVLTAKKVRNSYYELHFIQCP